MDCQIPLNSFLADLLDGSGLYGDLFYWSSTIALCGSAVLFFIYFWKKGRLDMDESPAEEMLQHSEDKYER